MSSFSVLSVNLWTEQKQITLATICVSVYGKTACKKSAHSKCVSTCNKSSYDKSACVAKSEQSKFVL